MERTVAWKVGVGNVVGDPLEFRHGVAGPVEVAGGDGDVDEHRQQARPGQRGPGVAEAAGDGRQRAVGAALGQEQEGPPAARLTVQLLGPGEGLLGPVELAEPAADVPDLGVGRGAVGHMAPEQLLAGPGGLPFRLGQGTAPFQHDGPVDAADAGKDGERVLLRPLHGRLGPLVSPVEVAELLAGADEAAVDLARGVRAEATLHGEEHRLVEVAETVGHLAPVDHDPAHRLEGLAPRGRGTGACGRG